MKMSTTSLIIASTLLNERCGTRQTSLLAARELGRSWGGGRRGSWGVKGERGGEEGGKGFRAKTGLYSGEQL